MTTEGQFPYDLAALAILLLLNRTVVASLRHPAAFWGFQAVNLGGALYFALAGIAGLDNFPVASWIVAALLLFHGVQNVVLRSSARPSR